MVRTTTDDATDESNVEYTHSVNIFDLSVGDAVRLSHRDVVVTQIEPFDTDDPNAPTIGEYEFGHMPIETPTEEGRVGGVSAARNAEAVAHGDYLRADVGSIPDGHVDIRAGFVTCDKCDAVVDADDDPWASVSVSPHGSNDRDDSFAVSLCGSCAGDVAEATGHDRSTVDDPELVTDGGRPPRDSFDHAPDVGPSDVDTCRECGRYASHAFDHAPECSRFESIDDEPDVSTTDTVTPSAANNPRMVRPKADGGMPFDTAAQSPERIASEIVAAQEGDDVVIQTGGDDLLAIYDGEVVSTGYKDADDGPGGTHVVAVQAGDVRVAVHFDRVIDDWELTEPEPVVFDPQKGRTTPVTRFEGADG